MQTGIRSEGVGITGAASRERRWPVVTRRALRDLADLRAVALLVVVAIAYAATARISLLFVLEPQNVAGIWPPAGIALGSLLLTTPRRWPPILAGVAIAVMVANVMAGSPTAVAAGFTVANTLEPLLAALLLRRFAFTGFDSIHGVGVFMGAAALAAPGVAAVIGATTATLGFGAPFLATAITWFLSDAAGIMAIAPLLVAVRSGGLRFPATWSRRIEGALLGLLVIGITAIAFLPLGLAIQLQAYPVFLLLVVAAVRFGGSGAALFTFAVALLAVGGTIAGGGPIVQLNDLPSVRIGQAQILVIVAFLASFVTASAMAERQMAAAALADRMDIEAEHAARSERITAFAREISRSLEADALFRRVAQAAAEVVPADVVQLTVAGPKGSDHSVVAAVGAPNIIGRSIAPGDGVTGWVIRDGRAITLERAEPADRAATTAEVLPDRAVAITCVPIIADGVVVATLGMSRFDLDRPFDADEVRALTMMGDLTAVALANALEFGRVHDRSIRDSLTGVPNRRYFDLSMEQLSAQRLRQPAETRLPVSAILFDLDHFGAVNKERGHETGDRVLEAFGAILASSLRRADIVARYGGEEFVAVLVGTDRDGAEHVAEKVRRRFERAALVGADGAPIRATVSAGISSIAASEKSLARLVSTADVALSMAKRAGRNQVVAAA